MAMNLSRYENKVINYNLLFRKTCLKKRKKSNGKGPKTGNANIKKTKNKSKMCKNVREIISTGVKKCSYVKMSSLTDIKTQRERR